MKNPTPQQLLEIDRCFQHVVDNARIDEVNLRTVFFGSTVDNWFRSLRGERRATIVIAGHPPSSLYERAYLRSQEEE